MLFPLFLFPSGPFLLSQLPGRSSREQAVGVGLWGDTEPCPPFPPPALAAFVPLANSPGPPGLLCFRKAFQFGRANTAEEKGNTLQNCTRPSKESFLGLFFNFLIWPQAKNVSCIFFFGPSPPPTPSLVSAIPRVLISHHETGKSQKWPGAAQLAWVPPLPSHKAQASSGVPGRSVGPGVGLLGFQS